MHHRLTIALAQLETTPDPAANLAKAETFARQAAAAGANLVVFPEMFMGMPLPDRPPAAIAAEDGGAFLRGIGALAADTGVFITAGCWEPGPDSRHVFNTAYTISPGGASVAAYRKLHLFDALSVRESDTMAPGDTLPPLVTIAGLRIGFAICYDLRFPELFRHLAVNGAELIVVPSAWYQGPLKEDHWLTLLRARAIENTLYVAGCNLVGASFCGRSSVFDPFGVPVAGAGEEPTLLTAVVDAGRIAAVRGKLPSLKNRRDLSRCTG
jgi:predicted amidohydrolase